MNWTVIISLGVFTLTSAAVGCSQVASDCGERLRCGESGGGGESTGLGGTSAGGGAGSTGGGGSDTGCTSDADCTDRDAAHCDDTGQCVAGALDDHCTHCADTNACVEGSCRECSTTVPCGGSSFCDLASPMGDPQRYTCVMGPGDQAPCASCVNDDQCQGGLCVPLSFEGNPHGYYCLKEFTGACDQPLVRLLAGATSANGVTKDFCSLDEARVTCEAIRAAQSSQTCAMDGECGGSLVPGALCRAVGTIAGLHCTYACDDGFDCVAAGQYASCGSKSSMQTPPWCGG